MAGQPGVSGFGALSPHGQSAYNKRHVEKLLKALTAIRSGDVNKVNEGLRALGGQRTPLLASMRPLMTRAASDITNLGGLSPEVRSALTSFRFPSGMQAGGVGGAENTSAGNAIINALGEWAGGIPQVTQTPEGRQVQLIGGVPAGMSPEEYGRLNVTNQMLQYLDPETRRETQQYLARANPDLFRAYGMNPNAGTPVAPGQFDQAALINQIRAALTGLQAPGITSPAGVTPGQTSATPQSQLNWMRDYLNTAMGGLGGTRAQQQQAQGRLKTLEEEARQGGESLGQYLTLAENITNPLGAGRGPLSGLLGRRRLSGQPQEEFMRQGLTRRNPFLT